MTEANPTPATGERTVWRWQDAPTTNLAQHPLRMQEPEYPLLVGVDGRFPGVCRRFLGMAELFSPTLVRDPSNFGSASVHPWAPFTDKLLGNGRIPALQTWPDEFSSTHPGFGGFRDVWSFSLPQRNNPRGGRVSGIIGQDDTYGILHIFYYVEGAENKWYYDVVRRPVYPVSDWNRPGASTSGDHRPVYFCTGNEITPGQVIPVAICTAGSYIYIGPATTVVGSGHSHAADGLFPLTLWFDRALWDQPWNGQTGAGSSGYGSSFGFVSGWFGNAKYEQAEVAHKAPLPGFNLEGAPNIGGISVAGKYLVSYRLLDPARGLYTNLTEPREISNNAHNYSFPLNAEFTDETASFRAFTRGAYPKYEVFSTLSTDDTGMVRSAGGSLWWMDRMTAGVRTSDTLLAVTLFHTRRENNSPGGRDNFNVNDATLAATNRPWDAELDTLLTPRSWLAVAEYQGATVVAGLSEPEDDDRVTEAGGSRVRLWWSMLHTAGQESFPVVNTQAMNLRGAPGRVALQKAGDSLYLLGCGEVQQLRRNGQYLEITSIGQSLTLLNRHAVTSMGHALVVMAKNGVWAIDGNTGGATRLARLSRLLRELWTSGHDTISVAYDDTLDAVFFYHAGRGEAVVWWLESQSLTQLDGLNALLVTTQEIPCDTDVSRRALFIGKRGRCFTPRYAEADDVPYTMQGLPDTNAGWNLKVVAAGSDSLFPGKTQLVLGVTGAETASTPLFPAHVIDGSVGVFLDGSRRGTAYTLTAAALFPQGANTSIVYLDAVLPDPSALVGSTLALSPVRFLVVGPAIAGQEASTMGRRFVNVVGADVRRYTGNASSTLPVLFAGTIRLSELQPATVPAGVAVAGSPGFVKRSALSVVPIPAEGTLSDEDPQLNTAPIEQQGNVIFPFIGSDVSDFGMDLLEATFTGTIGGSEQEI